MELSELSENKQFQALSSEAKGIAFDRLAEKNDRFKSASKEAQTIIRNKIIGNPDHRIEQINKPQQQPTEMPSSTGQKVAEVASAAFPAAEPAASIASGMVATPLANLAAIGVSGAGALGMLPKKYAAGGAEELDPQKVKEGIQESLTYQPKTETGKAGLSIASMPGQAISYVTGNIGDALRKATGSNIFASGAEETLNQAAGFLGVKGAPKVANTVRGYNAAKQAELTTLKSQRAERDAVTEAGKKAGYKFTPSEAGGSVGKALEGMSAMHIPFAEGHASAIDKAASLANADITDNLGRQALGLPKDAPLTKDTFDQYRDQQAKAYQAIESMPQPIPFTPQYLGAINNLEGNISAAARRFPGVISSKEVQSIKDELSRGGRVSPKEAIQAMRYLREQAANNLSFASDSKAKTLGKIQKNAAKAIEDLVEQGLQGNPSLMNSFREARTNMAKSYALEESMVGGRLSAAELAKSDAPLTGELKLIADMQTHHPSVMKDASKIKGKGVDKWADFGIAATATALGQPLAGAAIASRPAIRSAMLSKAYQKRFIGAPKYEISTMRGAFPEAIQALGNLGAAIPSQTAEQKRLARQRELKNRKKK